MRILSIAQSSVWAREERKNETEWEGMARVIKGGGSGQQSIAFRDLAATRCVVYSQNISQL